MILCRVLRERRGLLGRVVVRFITTIVLNNVISYLVPHYMCHSLVLILWRLAKNLECKMVLPTCMEVPLRLTWPLRSLTHMDGYRYIQHFSLCSASWKRRHHFTQRAAILPHISKNLVEIRLDGLWSSSPICIVTRFRRLKRRKIFKHCRIKQRHDLANTRYWIIRCKQPCMR